MFEIYLKEADLRKAEDFPAVALINEAANSDIVEFVDNLTHGVGTGYDFSVCTFWADLDEFDRIGMTQFEGVMINNETDEEIIMPLSELAYYLEILYSRLENTNYSELTELRKKLDTLKKTI